MAGSPLRGASASRSLHRPTARRRIGRAAFPARSFHDLHATILHLLGLDHERLTYRYAGRDMRLTDVKGVVHKAILA
jgi:hypothetical protein